MFIIKFKNNFLLLIMFFDKLLYIWIDFYLALEIFDYKNF